MMRAISYLWVGLGGGLGAILRVALSTILPSFILSIPLKILCVNILGCFALGLLTEIMAVYWNAPQSIRYFLVPGLLGGFTTFSAFSLEFGLLYKEGYSTTALIYAALSVVLSLGFFFVGLKIVRSFSLFFQN